MVRSVFPDAAPEPLRVAVRSLCDFAARTGDLDHRFTPAPSALEGIAGHASVGARRPAHYQRECPLAGPCEGLWLQGRADGVDRPARRLEEIKTHRGDPALITPNRQALHWAQARVYGWLLCEAEGWDTVELALVYYDIDSGVETVLRRPETRTELAAFARELCVRYRDWALQERAHRTARDAALATLPFPFAHYRAGQRELTEAVFRAQRAARPLLAQAPTGIGKTVATLFGALRAMPLVNSDQLLVLTPKSTGRAIALDGLQRLKASPLRVLERQAREKACEHPDKDCHGESCPLARGFYDRLGAARTEAAQRGWLDRAALRDVALAHGICPYYLAQEMQRWADVVVGDVNHWFDLNAQAWSLAQGMDWRVQLLVDEAHNLAERARRMHSAELDPLVFAAWRAQAPAALKGSFQSLHRAWGALALPEPAAGTVLEDELPTRFVEALGRHVATLTDFMARHPQAAMGLQSWLFEAVHWLRVAEDFGAHSVFERAPGPPTRRGSPRPRLALRCLLPAELLAPRWAGAHAASLFSATLSPMAHTQALLGLPANTAQLDVPSPFDAAQWSVRVARLSTRWADRARTLPRLVDELATHYHAQPGNHLAFFSSFDYLAQVLQAFAEAHPEVPVWSQSRSMDEAGREAFIARFVEGGQGLGFAVLGGVFGEGIDLPGSRLVGVSIATLGLAPPDALSEALRQRLQQQGRQGWADTYLYPGLHKVVQAAGRLIRTPEDRGTLLLLDERFASAEVRALLPPWWGLG